MLRFSAVPLSEWTSAQQTALAEMLAAILGVPSDNVAIESATAASAASSILQVVVRRIQTLAQAGDVQAIMNNLGTSVDGQSVEASFGSISASVFSSPNLVAGEGACTSRVLGCVCFAHTRSQSRPLPRTRL